MTLDEYKALAATATPETFQAVFSSLLSELTADLTTADSLAARVEEQDRKIIDLQETNQKLFLSQTAPAPKATPEESPADGIEGLAALDLMADAIKTAHAEASGIELLTQ